MVPVTTASTRAHSEPVHTSGVSRLEGTNSDVPGPGSETRMFPRSFRPLASSSAIESVVAYWPAGPRIPEYQTTANLDPFHLTTG